MFKKNKSEKSDKQNPCVDFSIIGENMLIKGDISSVGNIRIDGKVEGDINTQAKLILGPKGIIDGSVFAKTADIEGIVIGKIEIEDLLHLKSTATVQGDVKVGKIAIDQGAKFDANCRYTGLEVSQIKPLLVESSNEL